MFTTCSSTSVQIARFPHIADVHRSYGHGAHDVADHGRPRLLIEVPHGSTSADDFRELAAQLRSPLPDDLIAFFFVNTDTGAFETSLALADALPDWDVTIVRSRIPRTFVDCNRLLDAGEAAWKEGGVTAGMGPWITDAADVALLKQRYDEYQQIVRSELAHLRPHDVLVMMHTYSPRHVAVEVDLNIVPVLRAAYQPDVYPTWKLRPPVDIIARDLDGQVHLRDALIDALTSGFAAMGQTMTVSDSYPLHPSTMAWFHQQSHAGDTLCVELRRDLLTAHFEPFGETVADAARIAPLATVIAQALVSTR